MKEENSKGKYWVIEMYEDSRPNNWKEILEKTMLKICISPRHDKDKKDDGTLKKPHYHILLCFEGPTTLNNVRKIAKRIGNEYAEQVYSPKGTYEYFIHKNNPEKAQYSENDYVYLNGFKKEDLEELTKLEIEEIKRTIVKIIRNKNINEYSDIYDYLLDNEMYDLTKVLSTNTIFFVAYIRSRKFKEKEIQKIFTNP